MSENEVMDPLDAAEARRTARREARESESRVQAAADVEAIDELEVELGDENIAVIVLPFTAGLPTRAAVRTPNEPEIKRYRAMVRPRKADGEMGDTAAAAEQLGRKCCVYPPQERRAELFASRPGLAAQLGVEAVHLSQGKAESDGKK